MAGRWYAAAALYTGATWATYSYMTRKKPPPESSEDTATFDQLAALYDQKVGTEETFMFYGLLRWWVLRQVKGDVLEISAGTGRNLPYYDLSAITSLTLTDLSKPMLEQAEDKYYDTLRLNFKHPQQQVAFRVADAHCLLHDPNRSPPAAATPEAASKRPPASDAPAPTMAFSASTPPPSPPKPSWFSNIWRPTPTSPAVMPPEPAPSDPSRNTADNRPPPASLATLPPAQQQSQSPFSQIWKSSPALSPSPSSTAAQPPSPSNPSPLPPTPAHTQDTPSSAETPPAAPAGVRIQFQFSLPTTQQQQQQQQAPSFTGVSGTSSTGTQQAAAAPAPHPRPTTPPPAARTSPPNPPTPTPPAQPAAPPAAPAPPAACPPPPLLAPACQCHQRQPAQHQVLGTSATWAERCSEGASGGHALSKFPSASFDCVVDTFGLCSHEDPVVVLREAARLCRPGGQIVLLEHGRSSYDWLNKKLDEAAEAHHRRWGCWWNRDIVDIVEEAGLHVDSVSRWHFGTTYVIKAVPGPAAGPPA